MSIGLYMSVISCSCEEKLISIFELEVMPGSA